VAISLPKLRLRETALRRGVLIVQPLQHGRACCRSRPSSTQITSQSEADAIQDGGAADPSGGSNPPLLVEHGYDHRDLEAPCLALRHGGE